MEQILFRSPCTRSPYHAPRIAVSPKFRRHALRARPTIQILVSRAIYKGILKFIAKQNDYEYQVQPLPVNHLRTEFIGTHEIKLTWRAVEDPLEPTATPEKYIVYTRIGNGAFDSGTLVSDTSYTKGIIPDSIYSFKVTAVNSGGESFPSETVSLCRCSQEKGTVMVINGFDRISAPDSFEIDTLMQASTHARTSECLTSTTSVSSANNMSFDEISRG